MSAFFDAKNLGYLKFMVCPHGQVGREVEPVWTYFG